MKEVSVILPLVNETVALRETVDVLIRENAADIGEILIVTCARTTDESRREAADLSLKYPGLMQIFDQTRPLLGGAVRDAIDRARLSYVLLMASDLETPPQYAKDLIARIRFSNASAVLASRWLRPGGLPGYSFVKKICNRVFQKFFGLLFGCRLTDLTYGYWIRRRSDLARMILVETTHAITLECNLKQIQMGNVMDEVPVVWRRRDDGVSLFRLSYYASYFRAGFTIWFAGLGGRASLGPHRAK